jgi:hypothetical protein
VQLSKIPHVAVDDDLARRWVKAGATGKISSGGEVGSPFHLG